MELESGNGDGAGHESDAAQPTGRNIILLSDGTGNSAGKLMKTNVWRLYQSLDLSDGTQLAFYDDGVGSTGFRLFKALGGAVGLGLARNVRELYTLLCEHYRPPKDGYPGDRIYIFGFSRGAFTARILADLIGSCGIIDRDSDIRARAVRPRARRSLSLQTRKGLDQAVSLAYRSYRRRYRTPLLARPFRWLMDRLGKGAPDCKNFRARFSHPGNRSIEAVGVWDTVAAYGLPVDELTGVIDHLFYNLRFQEQDLGDHVKRAYHALAIDDERHSFHPLLWNEHPRKDRGSGLREVDDSDRIQQVWFTGMHADVGGGYPNGGLSFIPFNWMVESVRDGPARPLGLRFDPVALEDFRRRAAETAPIHDSRAGLAKFYRYKPRTVEQLNNKPGQVKIARAKVHASVLSRIASDSEAYSPPGLPSRYEIVGQHRPLPLAGEDRQDEPAHRNHCQERITRHVFWRQLNYYAMLLTALALATMPLYRPPVPGLKLNGLAAGIEQLFGLVTPILPGFVQFWTAAWSQSAGLFLLMAAVFTALFRNGTHIAGSIHRLAEAGWAPLKYGRGQVAVPGRGLFEKIADWMFDNDRLKALGSRLLRAWPGIFVALLAILLAVAAYRLLWHGPRLGDGVCHLVGSTPSTEARQPDQALPFSPRDPCLDTGLKVMKGRDYRIEVSGLENWRDGRISAELTGLEPWYAGPLLSSGIFMRRHMHLPWFTLVAEIGKDSGVLLPLRGPSTRFTATASGRVYLYVNDAVNTLGLPIRQTIADPAMPDKSFRCWSSGDLSEGRARSREWCAFYGNNQGTAQIRLVPEG